LGYPDTVLDKRIMLKVYYLHILLTVFPNSFARVDPMRIGIVTGEIDLLEIY